MRHRAARSRTHLLCPRTTIILTVTSLMICSVEGWLSSLSKLSTIYQNIFTSQVKSTSHLIFATPGDEYNESDEGEVDAARIRFEALISSSSSSPLSSSLSSSSARATGHSQQVTYKMTRSTRAITLTIAKIPSPPLTAIMLERRLAEIDMLTALEESDDVMADLWSLWFSERGSTAATLLLRAEELVSLGESNWAAAEELLWDVICDYGVHWAEPINRLATLKFLQGKLSESKELCQIVLKLKPWHFGALSGMVMVCAGLNDVNNARIWADRRLPPLLPKNTSGDRRSVWVQNACRAARECLKTAEKDRRAHNLGEEEIKFRVLRQKLLQDTQSNGDNPSDDSNRKITELSDDVWQ